MTRFAHCCLLALLCLTGTGCPREPPPIRLSINAWPGYEFLYHAEQKGFFSEEGVDVQLVQFGSLSDTRLAFERGQIDGMAATVIEVLQAQENSERVPQIFLVTDYSNGADFILSRPEIKQVTELRGQRVGLELASLGVYMLARMLEQHGMTLADVTLISSDQSTMEELLHQREIDAVVTYPPVALQLQKTPGINTLFTSADIPGEIIDVLALDRSILQKYPDKAAAIIRAFYRAIAYAEQQPDESYRIMGEREGMSAEAFNEALNTGIMMLSLQSQIEYFTNEKNLQETIRTVEIVLRDSQQLKKTIDTESVINSEPLRRLGVLAP